MRFTEEIECDYHYVIDGEFKYLEYDVLVGNHLFCGAENSIARVNTISAKRITQLFNTAFVFVEFYKKPKCPKSSIEGIYYNKHNAYGNKNS